MSAPPDPEPSVGLSVVAIMRNESLNLPGLIANLRGWVDELVLVDDGSDDDSTEIARGAGEWVRVVHRRKDDREGFAGLRNSGLDVATGSWILHMDCDERVSPELAQEIREGIRDTELNGFRYRRANLFLHRPMRHGGWDRWNRPQIARRGAHRFEGNLHERCVIDGGEDAIGQLVNPMLHLNDKSYLKRIAKSAQYVEMEAKRIEAAGRPITGLKLLARPVREFLKRYLLQRGFLDGVPGFIAASHSASATFRAYAIVWDRQNRIDRARIEDDMRSRWADFLSRKSPADEQ